MTAERRAELARVALRAVVSITLVAFLVWKIPLRDVAASLRAFPVSGLLLSLLVMALQLVIGAMRWRRMLVRAGVREPLGRLIADVLVGSAYNMVLPSAVGGDVVRAIRAARRMPEPHHAYSTVLFERMIGIPSLAVVAAPGILVVPGGESLIKPTIAVAVVSALVLLFADAPLRKLSSLFAARAPRVASIGAGVAADLRGPLGTPGARAEAFAWSLLYQLMGISILTACIVPAWDAHLALAIYAGVPLIVLGAMLPITIAGIGLRESLFVVVLGRLGVPEAQALALSFLWLLSYVVLALPGIVLVWKGTERAPAPP